MLPLALLAAVLASWRPRWMAGVAIAGALAFTLVPYIGAALHRTDGRSAEASFWAPALELLAEDWTPDYRVEVVPTGDHWESYWLPRAGFPLARGWYRQLDIAQNPLFYESPLEPEAYRAVARLAWASATCSSRTRSSGASGRSARPSSCAPGARGSSRSAARAT